jgi:UDP-N-acetylmuramate: L-alanyl-gamma-D-glutamyl-meso-diaminopimelate ligase
MRRKVFEESLPKSLALADRVILGGVFRAQQLGDENRLDPGSVAESVRRLGKDAHVVPSADQIADYLGGEVKEGDLLLVMSNGSFDGLCEKLLKRLALPATLPSEASFK